MFQIRGNAFTPHKAWLEGARKRLPEAHRIAHEHATHHLHQQAVEAADEAGLDTTPIVIGRRKGAAYVGIAYTPAGDVLADNEYGRPDSAPNPVLRQAITQAHPEAAAIYNAVLRSQAGL